MHNSNSGWAQNNIPVIYLCDIAKLLRLSFQALLWKPRKLSFNADKDLSFPSSAYSSFVGNDLLVCTVYDFPSSLYKTYLIFKYDLSNLWSKINP